MFKSCVCLVAPCMLLFCPWISWAQESRTWQSLDGSASVEATFVAYDSKTKSVELLTDTDQTIKIDLSKLSKTDQRFVKLVARKNRKTTMTPEADAAKQIRKTLPRKNRNARKGKQGSLFGINWTLDLDKALQVAEGSTSSSDDRPVMWLRVLGDLNGFM